MIRDQIKVFLNYAKEDVEYARRLNNDLKNESINVWYDENSLLGGQRWKTAIRNAIRDSDYFIALLSSKSVSKKGYVQKELKEAFDCLGEMPESDIFVIPVRIDDCKPSHEKLDEIHWVDIFPDWKVGLRKILNTIKSYNTQLKNIQHIDMQKNEYDSSLVGYQAKIGDKLIRVNRIQYEILSRLEKIHPKPGFYRDFEDFLNEDILVKNLVDLRDVELVTFKELVSKTCGNYGKITDIALINITKNGRYYLMESKQEIKESHNDRIIINKIKQDIKNLFRDSKTPAGGSHIYKKHICLF